MNKRIEYIKSKLDESISQVCNLSWMFCTNPGRDFTRNRKLPLRKVISFLLSAEGGTLTTEMLKHFGYHTGVATTSALVQQRRKIRIETLATLFNLFVKKTDSEKTYKGLRLIAADGSDFQIPTNPNHPESFYQGTVQQSSYNILHLDVTYDLLQHTYLDAIIEGKNKANERKALCAMIARSSIKKALVILDRGYENYNLMAHIQEKGWLYLVRVRDVGTCISITSGFDLPNSDEFDMFVDLNLTNKQAKELKQDRNHYRFIPSNVNFDYLPRKSKKCDVAVFYHLPFRIVRFKITDNSYETVVTNLDETQFPPAELKKLYAMRWGIETSFRDLKYTVGLLHFHSKKIDFICQEIYARLIMYNFSELITASVTIPNSNTKYTYKVNFSAAVHICRQLLCGSVSPSDVNKLLQKYISPVRPGRSRPRKISVKYTVCFTYRVA